MLLCAKRQFLDWAKQQIESRFGKLKGSQMPFTYIGIEHVRLGRDAHDPTEVHFAVLSREGTIGPVDSNRVVHAMGLLVGFDDTADDKHLVIAENPKPTRGQIGFYFGRLGTGALG